MRLFCDNTLCNHACCQQTYKYWDICMLFSPSKPSTRTCMIFTLAMLYKMVEIKSDWISVPPVLKTKFHQSFPLAYVHMKLPVLVGIYDCSCLHSNNEVQIIREQFSSLDQTASASAASLSGMSHIQGVQIFDGMSIGTI